MQRSKAMRIRFLKNYTKSRKICRHTPAVFKHRELWSKNSSLIGCAFPGSRSKAEAKQKQSKSKAKAKQKQSKSEAKQKQSKSNAKAKQNQSKSKAKQEQSKSNATKHFLHFSICACHPGRVPMLLI